MFMYCVCVCICFGFKAEPIMGLGCVYVCVGVCMGVCVCVCFGFQAEPVMGLRCVCLLWVWLGLGWVWCVFVLGSELNL